MWILIQVMSINQMLKVTMRLYIVRRMVIIIEVFQ